eukprot:PhM_4_TR8360/c0_g1_i1/m.14626
MSGVNPMLMNRVNRELSAKAQKLEEKVMAKESANVTARNEIARSTEQVKEFRNKVVTLSSSAADVARKQSIEEQHAKTCETEVKKLSSEQQRAIEQIRTLTNNLSAIEAQVDSIQQKVDEKESAVERARQELLSHLEVNRIADNATSAGKESDGAHEYQIRLLQKRADDLTHRVKVTRDDFEAECARGEEIEHEANKIAELTKMVQSEYTELIGNCNAVAEQTTLAGQRLEALKYELELAEQRLRETKQRVESTKAELKAEELNLEGAESTGAKTRNTRDTKKKTIDEMATETRNLQTMAKAMQGIFSRLYNERAALQAEQERLHDAQDTMHQRFLELSHLKNEMSAIIGTETDAVRSADDAGRAAVRLLEQTHIDLDVMEDNIMKMNSALDMQRMRLKEEQQNEAMRHKTVQTLEAALHRCSQKQVELEASLSQLVDADAVMTETLFEMQFTLKTEQFDRNGRVAVQKVQQMEEIRRLQDVLATLEREGRAIMDALTSAKAQANRYNQGGGVEATHAALLEDVRVLELEIQSVQQDMMGILQERRQASERCQALQLDIENLEHKNKQLRHGLQEQQVENVQYQSLLERADIETGLRIQELTLEARGLEDDRRRLNLRLQDAKEKVYHLKSRYDSAMRQLDATANVVEGPDTNNDSSAFDPLSTTPEEVQARYLFDMASERTRLQSIGDGLDDAIVKAERDLSMLNNAHRTMQDDQWQRWVAALSNELGCERTDDGVNNEQQQQEDEVALLREEAERTRMLMITWKCENDAKDREHLAALKQLERHKLQLQSCHALRTKLTEEIRLLSRRNKEGKAQTAQEKLREAKAAEARMQRARAVLRKPEAPFLLDDVDTRERYVEGTRRLQRVVMQAARDYGDAVYMTYRRAMDKFGVEHNVVVGCSVAPDATPRVPATTTAASANRTPRPSSASSRPSSARSSVSSTTTTTTTTTRSITRSSSSSLRSTSTTSRSTHTKRVSPSPSSSGPCAVQPLPSVGFGVFGVGVNNNKSGAARPTAIRGRDQFKK